ncbi:rRNA-processing protein bfr2 [Ascosphaera aggregata]|nr:rRNA-processing protein bfr2 [Ascosphaera aggregata]
MAPGKRRSLVDQLAELGDPAPLDFDAEDVERQDDQVSDSEGSSSADEGDGFTGREHYEVVGYDLSTLFLSLFISNDGDDDYRKSKLRKSDEPDLGKNYAGSEIRRDALMNEEGHDPFAKSESADDKSEEDEDDEMFESEDEDEDGEEHGGSESLGSDLEGLEQDTNESDSESVEGDEDEESSDDSSNESPTPKGTDPNDTRSELRRLMSHDAKTVASTISAAAKADAEKGRAVKKQRLGYDALVGVRMKMQKAVTGIIALSELNDSTEEVDIERREERTAILEQLDGNEIRKAESAALNLWNTIEGLRGALADAHRTGSKRKRDVFPTPDTETPGEKLWERMEMYEQAAQPYRRAVLEKWATKTRGVRAALPSGRGKLMATATGMNDQQGIGAVLDSYIAAEQKTKTPVYDDAQFYQSLLRTLIEERMAATSSTASAINNLDNSTTTLPTSALSSLSLLPKTNVAGMRKDKVKRDIDTKASKGRKMRYNVHEKLQNFMAPEDRGSWGKAAREEFFASLLGKSAAGILGEEADGERDEDADQDPEEGGLMLFRQ